jgi:hypothetical protein
LLSGVEQVGILLVYPWLVPLPALGFVSRRTSQQVAIVPRGERFIKKSRISPAGHLDICVARYIAAHPMREDPDREIFTESQYKCDFGPPVPVLNNARDSSFND